MIHHGYFPQKLQYFLTFLMLVFIWTFIYLSQSPLINKFPVLLYKLEEKDPVKRLCGFARMPYDSASSSFRLLFVNNR